MLFSSALFVFGFLPVVLGVNFVLPRWLRNAWLLLASLIFYAWGEPVIALVMLASIAANYALGLLVARASSARAARAVLVSAVAFNLGLLVFFKYADWLWSGLGTLLAELGLAHGDWALLGSHLASDSPWRTILLGSGDAIRLPIGISFFSFQALSYVIDVHRREAPVQKNPLDVALYVALFPQLIAGPIVRYRDVARELAQRTVTRAGFAEGVRRFVLGLAKKMLIANLCAEAADGIFGTDTLAGVPGAELTPALAWLGIAAYTLQIYFDFSGYSDMAIGLGLLFGFRFLENFDYPYVARSITEFWRRWHISLSSWFRDYLYVPLGGNRRGPARTYANLLVVFVLCGLWHGANLTFLVWGLFHGVFLVLERIGLGAWLARRPAALRHVYVLLVVMVGWVFFRVESLAHARDYLAALAGLQDGSQLVSIGARSHPAAEVHLLAAHAHRLTWLALAAGVLGSIPWLPRVVAFTHRVRSEGRAGLALVLEAGGLLALVLLFAHVAMALASGGYNPFIYFRF
ncbi:MAG: MBOAT family O-acyltransferase [Planctomycetota bacterium]